ncbi:hypothetical protein HanRHA438_Chr13g0595811 [Helianthus annuus]|nr:hypothetical protein HanRHA438_Chr13g0595811 [Helianthus annuus]
MMDPDLDLDGFKRNMMDPGLDDGTDLDLDGVYIDLKLISFSDFIFVLVFSIMEQERGGGGGKCAREER